MLINNHLTMLILKTIDRLPSVLAQHPRIMFLKLSILLLSSISVSLNPTIELPDYGMRSLSRALKSFDLRERLEKKSQDKKLLKLFLNSTNVVYLDGFAHFEVNDKFKDVNKVMEIENDFRKLIGMVGVKYLYKRDTSWRTWREVKYPEGKRVVCYRCSNVINSTCPKCNSGGYWIIEKDPPPCPYELFSMIDQNRLCAANYTQFVNIDDTCPSEIEFYDLSSCDNPIITKYQITESFDRSKYNEGPNHICEGQKYCEMTTFYRIYKDYVVFRIGNSRNDIIFSKIMKTGGKKFVCFNDCGHVDSKTQRVSVNDNPVTFDLLPSHKNKRENKEVTEDWTQVKVTKAVERKKERNNRKTGFKLTTTMSPCKKLQTTEDNEYNNSYFYGEFDEDVEI